jgi:hypothetical protein
MPEVCPVKATDEELWAGTYKEFLPESTARVEGLFGAAGTPLVAGRLPTDVGVRKLEGLAGPECTSVRCSWLTHSLKSLGVLFPSSIDIVDTRTTTNNKGYP